MRIARRTCIASCVSTGVIALAAVPALAATPQIVSSIGPVSRTNPEVKPGLIVYTGDGSGFLAGRGSSVRHDGSINWTSYTATSATGLANNWEDNCSPNCAQGKFTGYPVTLKAYDPHVVLGHDIFTRMTVTYTTGKKNSSTWKVSTFSRNFEWHFPPSSAA